MEIPYQMQECESEHQAYERRREELSRSCAKDASMASARLLWYLSGLQKRADATEESAKQLLHSLVKASPYENLLQNLELIKIFPEQFEGNQIKLGCEVLNEKVMMLERINSQLFSEKPSLSECERSKLEETKEKKISDIPLLKMYREMNQSEIIISLASEVNQLHREFCIMHKQHEMIQEAFNAVKGLKTWNILCKCMKEVKHMRLVLDAMTDGQFEQGIVEYVDPKRAVCLELKLKKTNKKLKNMELALELLKNFKVDTDAKLGKCYPILKQLHITEEMEDTSESDLKNANEISNRIGVMEVDVEHMSSIITLLMAKLEGRIALIEATIKKMELLDIAKADKYSVEKAFPSMADLDLIKKTVTFENLAAVFNEVGMKLMNTFGHIMEIMSAWDDILENLQLDSACKINKIEFAQLLDILDDKLNFFYTKVKDLEIEHIEEHVFRKRESRMKFKEFRCMTCDLDAVMNCRTDLGVPSLPCCPARYHIGPSIAYQLHKFRTQGLELLESGNPLARFQCPKERSCNISYENDRHCNRFGKHTCAGNQICTPPNTEETLMNVTDLGDSDFHLSPITSSNTKKVEGKKQISSQPSVKPKTSVGKNISSRKMSK